MIVGFTGTRYGMTLKQKERLGEFLRGVGLTVFHHGDCVGADDEAASLVRANLAGVRIVCHPPADGTHRAHNTCHDEIRSPQSHFARNRSIVQASQLVVATPWESQWQSRGGTWYTVDYARKHNRTVHIIYPDGRGEVTGPAGGS